MLAERTQSHEIFPVIMSAIVKAVDEHGDLLRMAIATPGNDFRLGACEAPPAILSTYLGASMTEYLKAYAAGGAPVPYVASHRTIGLGASVLPPLHVPSEDRNRTSPFPYGGNRFEFRAVGSSQNVSTVNMVCTKADCTHAR
jgi:glutamine synthetase